MAAFSTFLRTKALSLALSHWPAIALVVFSSAYAALTCREPSYARFIGTVSPIVFLAIGFALARRYFP